MVNKFASWLKLKRSSKTAMYILPVQILVLFLATFGKHCSVIARSLSQDASSKDVTSCVIKGDRNPHPINSSFITSDCTLQCYCSVSGVVSCMELCPQASPVQCPPGSELYEDEVPVGSGGVHCSCKRQYCVPLNVFCYSSDTNRKYKVGETFTLGNCSKSCRCNENGEILCTPMCPKIKKCGRGKRPKGRVIIALGEKRGCSCEIPECVPVPKEKFCRVDGRQYRRGRVFITKDCRLKCRCRKNGKTRCRPLCKTTPKNPVCKPDERLEDILEFFAGGRCMCKEKACLPEIRNHVKDSVVDMFESKL